MIIYDHYDPLVNSSIAPFGYSIFSDKATVISVLKSAAWSFFPPRYLVTSGSLNHSPHGHLRSWSDKDAASANDWLLLPPKNEQLQQQTKDF